MRKKLYRQITAAAVAGTMLFAMAACGTNNSGAANGAASEQTGGTESEQQEAAANDGEREFSYFGSIWSPYKETSPIFDELMEHTGITVDFEWVSEDGFDTLLASKVASQELPDVISGGAAAPEAINDMIEQGLIVPITDYLDNELANYNNLLTDEDKLYLTNQSDGEIYGFGLVMDVPQSYSTMIRTDWLERLNLEVPETWDEWMEVWRAFKNEDANGNGDPNDEVPFAFNYEFIRFVLNMFGMNSNGEFSVVDGEYVYDAENPNYEKFLDAMREMYAEGLIPQEYVTLVGTEFNTLGASNTLGSLVGYAEYAQTYTTACREVDENAFYQCVVPIQGPDGAQSIPARSKVTASAYITVAAQQNGHLDDILEFFNYVYSDEGILLTNYGIEGEHFDMTDGNPVLRAPYNGGFATARENGLIPSIIPFCFTQDVYMQILTGGLEYEEMDTAGQTFMDGMSINDPYYYSEPAILQTESYIEHFDLREQQVSLRDRYIMGQISKEEYQSQYQALKDAGLAQVIEDAKEAYKSMTE